MLPSEQFNQNCLAKVGRTHPLEAIFKKKLELIKPTLFSLFINELYKEIKEMNISIKIGDRLVSILFYADDMVLVVSREADLQKMLKKMAEWCQKWRLRVNKVKS